MEHSEDLHTIESRRPCSARRLLTDPTLGSFSFEAVRGSLFPSEDEVVVADEVVISVLPSSSAYSESGRLLLESLFNAPVSMQHSHINHF